MRSIGALHDELAAWAGEFDASASSVERCRSVLDHAAAIERIAAAVKAQAAERVARTGGWRHSGERSAAHELARATGTTLGAAREALETAAALRELPDLAAAARRGELSPTQTAAVAAVGTLAPDLVAGLVSRAGETTVAELRAECARAAATRDPDPEARRRAVHAQRSLRRWVDPGGVGVLQLRDTPEVIAGLMTDIAPAREALFRAARERGERVRPDALDADALVATVQAGRHGDDSRHRCAPRAKLLVRVDLDALLRGHPIDGEVCEIAGYGPVAVSAVRDLLADPDSFLAAIVTKGVQVTGVAHLGRRARAHQATALEWLNPTCATDGCTQTARLESDHRVPWARTKITLVELMDRLCEHCHDLKTHHGWALAAGTGKRPLVPPTDPRHPERQPTGARDPTSIAG
jgi:hypothetical protein